MSTFNPGTGADNPTMIMTMSTPNASAILACKICLEPCASPIYQCPNGHLICGVCYDKLEEQGAPKCPLRCVGRLTPSPLGERLSREYDVRIECRYSESGCSTPIKATELMGHLKDCDYREILCNFSFENPGTAVRVHQNRRNLDYRCNKLVSAKNYPQHLLEDHKLRLLKGDDHFVFTISPEFWNCPKELSFTPVPVELDGKVFLLNCDIVYDNGHFLRYWMTVMGSQNQADKFFVKTKLSPSESAKHEFPALQCEPIMTLPVLPVRHHPSSSSFIHGVISVSGLCRWYLGEVADGRFGFNLSWTIGKK